MSRTRPTPDLPRAARGSATKPRAAQAPGLVALVAYDGLRSFEYAMAVELFALQRPGLPGPWYPTAVVSAERGALRGLGGLVVRPDAAFETIHQAHTIVVPGWRDVNERAPRKLLSALAAGVERGARVLSICSGAFVLGQAGVLDGRRATTHWLFADDFRRQFPRAQYEADVLYVDEGSVITSAGSAAGFDAGLHLIRRDHGAAVANLVARRMVMAPHREGGQAQFVPTPVSARPARSVGRAMAWAQSELQRPLRVSELAARSAMSERTFLRHFRAASGMTPLAWLQRERVARARELLETSTAAPAEVATLCGFESEETFRAAFKRLVGVAPGAYRQRFARR